MHSWDTAYRTELENHEADETDTGQVWFSESNAEGRVIRFLNRLSTEIGRESTEASNADGTLGIDPNTTKFLDLGTGNGSMLSALREEGYLGEMLGVDYSEASIRLARRVNLDGCDRRDAEESRAGSHADLVTVEGAKNIRFQVWDFMRDAFDMHVQPHIDAGKGDVQPRWDVVLDKGTFDAISLNEQVDARGRRVVESYRNRVKPMIRRGGLLLITSCNWTEDELTRWFVLDCSDREEDGGFEKHGRVEYPTLRFGGHVGQTISTVCFKRT